MSDISQGDVTAAPETTAPAPAETAPAADPFDSPEVSSFDRAYVEKLRKEAAGYRTKAQPYDEVFGQYADEDREVWFDLAKTLATDPKAAAERFQQLAEGLKSQFAAEEPEAAPAEDADKPLTAAQIEKLLSDREAKSEQERAVKAITDQVAAKYKAGTPEHREVLWLAANQTNGDVDKAIELQAQREQAVVDRYLTGKQTQAQGPSPVTATGNATGEAQPIKDFAGAKAATMARLAASK